MKKSSIYKFLLIKIKLVFFLCLFSVFTQAQVAQVEIVGGAIVTQGSTITINAGSSLDFRITNVETSNCKNLKIQDVDISNTTDFDINPNNPKRNLKPASCSGRRKNLDFEIENISPSCTIVSTLVTIEFKDEPDFSFTLEVNSSPEVYVLGGDPLEDVDYNNANTTDSNGTYFGVVEEGATITRQFLVANIGSCDMNITSVTSNNADFAVSSSFGIPFSGIPPFFGIYLDVTFTGPAAGTGTQSATISVFTNDPDTNPFLINVSAEMFNENIPGPGGITANFKLWLKSTRGIVATGSTLTDWLDIGTNGKDATTVVGNEPTFLDTAADNINFNPVVKFENDGGATEQYMFNNDTPISGFYNHDIFIVMVPDVTINNTSTRNTIFAGIDSGNAGDITGIGFGNYSSEFTNETLSYNQDVDGGGSFNGEAVLNTNYSNPGIINVRNDALVSPTKQEILYNSDVLSTTNVSDVAFTSILGSEYWIGKNFDIQGSLNGRVAEIFTFSERLADADRQKVESYLAIKYGITLGAGNEAQKDYVNSFDTSVWDITTNAGYNYHVAGIGRDSISDLNQKQSKTLNVPNEVSISLGGLFDTNSANPNEFEKDGDFLVWGNNNAAFTGASTNTITVATGITTSITRIDRKWMIVESNEDVDGDVETVYLSIPSAAFSGFTKTATEEYALIVADNSNFADGDIIDVIPLRSDGGSNLQTWYNFDGTKYFTFGKVPKLSENHSVSIGTGDYLTGEFGLNLNVDNFTISAWIKCAANASNRTVMAKGEKLQIRLNTTGNIEVYIDDNITPKFTSNMDVDDGKWHHTTFVYDSGTILMYIDGVLDKSVQNIVHPSPNFNNFSIGAVYIDKGNIINPLMGEIDEVYVWDLELTESQVRYLMNQEIERFDDGGTDFVSGKIIPQASASNEVATIPWSSLRVYYDFNSFYGSTVEGLTDDRFFLRLKYLDKDKLLLDDQTTPLPYISANDGDWDTGTTWSNNADQIIPNSLSLDGSTIVDWNIVQISHNIDSGDRDISLLGLIQTDGKLTIADPVVTSPIEDNAGQGLTITNYLELDGVIDLVGESQLVQTEGSIIDADSGGFIERDQQGTANAYNYNYWSSSVGPISGDTSTRGTGISSTNANYTIVGILNDGSNSGIYQSLLYDASPTSGGTVPPPGLPKTISTNWLYKFYGTADDYFAWEKIEESSALLPGEGFSMKGTSGSAPIAIQQNYVFKGLPHNGDITLELDNSSEEVERLIGNPYPSAIDANEFILDNLSIADGGNNMNGTVINGALYFWDHFGQEDSHFLGEYIGGYATRNLTGGAVAIANDARINNDLSTGVKVPGPYIPVNQGFFVSTVLDGFNNDDGTPILTVDGGDIVFKNSQRVFQTEDGSNSLFLKSSSTKKSNLATRYKDDTPTVKLLYSSPLGYHRQIVIGANKKASDGFDIGYDAFMADVGMEDMYWNFNNKKFVIQGVDAFNNLQEFALGVKVKEAGIAIIRIDTLQNLDKNTLVFIKDENTGETHNISNAPFEIFLEPGEYKERFKLVFIESDNSLNIDEITNESKNILVYFDSNSSELRLSNKYGIYVSNVNLYNILGQRIKNTSLNSSSDAFIPLQVKTGAYIVKLNTENGIVIKKIVIE